MIRNCALCQEPFTPQSNRQAFCSRLCRSRAERSGDAVAMEYGEVTADEFASVVDAVLFFEGHSKELEARVSG